MRISLVTETYPPEVNGVAMTNQRLIRGLIAEGHRIQLVKPRRRDAPPPEHGALEIFPVFGIPIPNYAGLKIGLPAPGQLEQAFERFRPDVVHVATEGPLGFSALHAARKLGRPVTSTFHTNFQDYCADYGAAFMAKLTLRYLRWFHNRCALTTVPDRGLIRRLEADNLERLEYLGRGAATELFSPAKRDPALRAQWGAGEATPVALYVGRAAAEKNIPLALQAWQAARERCPELKMVVVGGGPVEAKLARQWPEVHFAGMRFDEDLARHYASADLFLFASRTETFGNVVLEAMSSGLVVHTLDYAAGAQFVRDGENGFLSPPEDGAAFIRRTGEILARRGDWISIREKARDTAMQHPWSDTIERFGTLLRRAAQNPARIPQIGIVPATKSNHL